MRPSGPAAILEKTDAAGIPVYGSEIEQVKNDLGIDLFTAYRLVASLRPYAFSFLHEAEPDESWDYHRFGLPVFSLCLPVAGELHGEEGVVCRKSSFPVYCQVLARLANLLAEEEGQDS